MKFLKRNTRSLSLITALLLVTPFCITGKTIASIDDTPLNAGDVLIGPCGVPGAMGPTGVNDDFTNRSINTGIEKIAPDGLTSAPGTVIFRNTIQNTGAGDDIFVLSAPISPSGFVTEISTDDGDHYVTLDRPGGSISLPVSYRAATVVLVRIAVPAGLKLLTGFDTVIRVTSTATSTATNDTINRIYTGFIRLEKSATIVSRASGATLATPGAEIEFVIAYSNVSTASGAGSELLTAHNLVISENGNSAPNNWGDTTDHIVGASDSQGGLIIGDQNGSTSLTDIVATLEAGQSGVFKFRRRIK